MAEEHRVATAALENVRREAESQRAELDAQRAAIDATLRDITERQQAMAERERRLSQEQAALASRADALAAERKALDDRAGELQRMLSDIDTSRSQLESDKQAAAEALAKSEAAIKARADAMQQRESELAEALLLLGRESQRLQARRVELEGAGGTSDGMKATCDALTAEKARLEARLEESQKTVSEFEARIATLSSQIAELSAQRAAANDRLIEVQAKALASETRSTELESEKAALAAQLATAEAKINEFTSRTADWETRNRGLVEQQSALAGERAKLAEQVNRLTAEKSLAQTELARLTAERDFARQANTDATATTEQLATLQSRLAEIEKRANELNGERTALMSRAAALEQERAQLIEHRKRLESQLAAVEKRCIELESAEGARVEARDLATRLEEQNANLETKLRALESQLASAEARKSGDAGAAALKNIELESEIAQLRVRVKELEAERDALAQRPVQLHPQVQDLADLLTPPPALDEPPVDIFQNRNAITGEAKAVAAIQQFEESDESSPAREFETPRKPSRFRALKMLAATALFALMVVAITFTSVYGLVAHVFRSEAIVKVVPPSDMKPAEVPAWLTRQATTIKSDSDVLQEAWTQMRDMGYSRYNTKEQWIASLGREMEVSLDSAAKKLSVRMLGDTQSGLSMASNAVAAAYVDKVAKLKNDSPHPDKAASAVLDVRAMPGAVTEIDHRMSLAGSISAGVLFAALLIVTLVRRAIMKDLRAIDEMGENVEEVAIEPQAA
jgi:predicted  nucleic acid-binding Zn-ribbon protein